MEDQSFVAAGTLHPRTVSYRSSYLYPPHLGKEEYLTHIATDVIGFKSLCCVEFRATDIELIPSPVDGKITCPLCLTMWHNCQAFGTGDFNVIEIANEVTLG